jgi:type I restriction enzyme S subunit
MTADLRPYPEYKDSGVEWLAQIPAHWDCLPHRALFQEIKDQGHVDEPLLSVTISKGIIQQSDLLAESSKKDSSNLDKSKYKLVVPGDIAYNKMRAWQGAVGVSRHRGIVSPAYIVVRLRNSNNPEYFHFLFRTPGFATEAERWSYGITSDQWSLRPEHFKMIYSCVPLLPEQDTIVAFLRHADARFRRFMRNRRRLIGALNEQKQAIINRAVTRGLDPNVPLKPSGIDWLGDIPEHWRILRGKFLFREVDKRSTTGEEVHLSMSQRYGLIRSSEIKERRLMSESYVGGKLCEKDDLVLNRLKAHLGVFALAPESGVLSPDYTVLRCRRELSPTFYEYFYRTPLCRVELRKRAKGIVEGFWRLYTDDFYNIPAPVPPVSEQRKIVEALDKDLKQIKLAVEQAFNEIDLIREYRTRLIADVVTGKVDVRHLVPPQEALAGEAEPEDLEEGVEDEMPGEAEAELAGEVADAGD